MGVERAYRFTAPTTAIVINYKTKTNPWSVAGGTPGQKNTVIVDPGLPEQREVGVSTNVFDTGGAITNLTGGGGGWGDPLKRDPQNVATDVLDGFVTPTSAKDTYGVVFSDDHGSIDLAKTQALRTKLSAVSS